MLYCSSIQEVWNFTHYLLTKCFSIMVKKGIYKIFFYSENLELFIVFPTLIFFLFHINVKELLKIDLVYKMK